MEKDTSEKIIETISKFNYSAEPFLEASKRINVYENFFELENFYFHNWEKQNLDEASGLCQHLTCITNKYLSNLVMGTRKFSDYYDIYYASGVYESRFFSWSYGNHICLLIFKKGDTEKGWIIDPSLKVFTRCRKQLNRYKDIINCKHMFLLCAHWERLSTGILSRGGSRFGFRFEYTNLHTNMIKNLFKRFTSTRFSI